MHRRCCQTFSAAGHFRARSREENRDSDFVTRVFSGWFFRSLGILLEHLHSPGAEVSAILVFAFLLLKGSNELAKNFYEAEISTTSPNSADFQPICRQKSAKVRLQTESPRTFCHRHQLRGVRFDVLTFGDLTGYLKYLCYILLSFDS